jgi:hypothetical protein
MALVGGGGAPNVAGGNPAGIGTSLNVIGDHCYATSGTITTGNTAATMLQFGTGAYYCIVNISYSVTRGAGGGTDNYELAIEFDGQAVMHAETASPASPTGPLVQLNEILIPPYTNVTMTTQNRSQDVDHDSFVTISGRVYA